MSFGDKFLFAIVFSVELVSFLEKISIKSANNKEKMDNNLNKYFIKKHKWTAYKHMERVSVLLIFR